MNHGTNHGTTPAAEHAAPPPILPDQARHPVLRQLLQECALQQPEYRGGLSSHLPMALIALAGMGASEARLQAYAVEYSQRMSPLMSVTTPATTPVADWRALRGQIDGYPALLAYFQHEVTQQGTDAVLRQVLPELMPGVGAAAFHGLIRLAYGVLAQSDSEIAAGLAYFAARYLDLGPLLPASGVAGGPDQQYLALAGKSPLLPPRDLIFASMQDASHLPGFAAQVASVQIDQTTMAELARCALQLFNVEANFVALHMVTSCHALRLLLPYFADPLVQAVPWLWQAHLAAFYAGKLGQQARMVIAGVPNAGFDARQFAAHRAEDDHSIKMVFTCLQEAAHYGDPARAYQQAAQRVCNSFG